MSEIDKIAIALSREEALVLFELLWRFSESGDLSIADKAEERVLWDLCCMLEKVLVEPFQPTYGESLQEARRVIGQRW